MLNVYLILCSDMLMLMHPYCFAYTSNAILFVLPHTHKQKEKFSFNTQEFFFFLMMENTNEPVMQEHAKEIKMISEMLRDQKIRNMQKILFKSNDDHRCHHLAHISMT